MSVDPPLRLLRLDDAQALADLWTRNREHLAPWSPVRPESFYTPEGQRAAIAEKLRRHDDGTGVPCAIVDGDAVVGELTLGDIVRGALQNTYVGYWLAQDATGRGLATRAVASALTHAFDDLDLHQAQAATLVHNHRSRAVLERNGFEQVGRAPRFLHIEGRWQDHLLFHRLAPGA